MELTTFTPHILLLPFILLPSHFTPTYRQTHKSMWTPLQISGYCYFSHTRCCQVGLHDIYSVTIEKRLSFISLCCKSLFTAIVFINWMTLRMEICNTNKHGGEWTWHIAQRSCLRGATSVTWTWFGYEKSDTDQKTVLCKICRRPDPTTGSNTTNLLPPTQESYGESLRMRTQKLKSSAQNKRGFCPRHTIWQRITKMKGDNSCCYNLHLQRHGPNLHGGETGVSWVGANTQPKVPSANWCDTY